jgi:hypothetical protein
MMLTNKIFPNRRDLKNLGKKNTMNSILFSNQKPTNGQKGKSYKMYVFAQDIGIRNSVKILLVSTVL